MLKTFKILSFLLFLLPDFTSYGQNLVSNHSFEIFNACPDTFVGSGGSNITAADYWYNPGGFTPDYLNACDTNITYPWFGVPINQYGNQSARTGVAYAGIILSYLYPSPGDSIREYVEAKLLDSLSAEKNYAVSFYVSLADRSSYAANDVGAYFSDTLISLPSYEYPLPFIPQIQNNPLNNPLIDTSLWVEVRDTFTAQGGEQYITIGNFKNDVNTDTTNLAIGNPNTDPWAYYYIDDVSVICIDCSVGIEDIAADEKIIAFPNPSSSILNIDVSNHHQLLNSYFYIYNFLGKEVKKGQILNDKAKIDCSNLPAGVYILSIQNLQNSQNRVKKIIISN